MERDRLFKNIQLFTRMLFRMGVSREKIATAALSATNGTPSKYCTNEQLKAALTAIQKKWLQLRAEDIFCTKGTNEQNKKT